MSWGRQEEDGGCKDGYENDEIIAGTISCSYCYVSTGCVLINKNEPRKFNVSGVLLCVFLKKVFVGLSRFLIVICVQYTRNIHARYNSFCIIYA